MQATAPTKTNVTEKAKMLGARVPWPVVNRFEAVVPAGARSQFIIEALAAALDRHVEEMSGAGAESGTVLS
jgi:hypothetical protein